MQIFITGATGLIGKQLTKILLQRGDRISILTRNSAKAKTLFANQVTTYSSIQDIDQHIAFDAIINLAGEPIADKRWTETQKQKLCQSRWTITEQLVQWINQASTPPAVFISGSAMGFYGSLGDQVITEQSLPAPGFTHDLCQKWESLALQADTTKTRICLLRTAVVLANSGGALAKLLPLFRYGLGGVIAGGKQYMAWIHLDDMINGICYLLSQSDLHGPFNMCAPHPVTNREFSETLAAVLHRPCLFPVPGCALRIIMGEGSTILTDSQRAVPEHLHQSGFSFKYPYMDQALRQICQSAN